MVTAANGGRRHRRGLSPGRERLRDQADRFSRRARADRHARVPQMGGRGPPRERRALCPRRARRQRRAVGLESDDERRLLVAALEGDARVRGVGDLGDGREEWLTRVHPDDRGRVEAALAAHICGWQQALRERASHPAPQRDVPLGALPRRGRQERRRDGDAPGRIADRHHRDEARGRVDRAAESDSVRRSGRTRDQAHGAPRGLCLRAPRARPRSLQASCTTASAR